MAEFKLDRFKYNWRGAWVTGTAYDRDDIVRFGGKSFVCMIGHTASANFYTDKDAILPGSNPPIPAPKWVVMTDGTTFVGQWQTGVMYRVGDIVIRDGSLYRCATHVHMSTTWAADESNWFTFINHVDFKGNWATSTEYSKGALVKYNGIVYRCIATHTSQAVIEDSISNWEIFHESIEYVGDWSNTTLYRLNDIVKYGGSLYRCVEAHNSGTFDFDFDKFQLELPGFQFENQWSPLVQYQAGDVVRDSGYLYYALIDNIDTNPTNNDSTSTWIVLAYAYNFLGVWQASTAYRAGDVVLRGGNLYLCLRDIGTGDADGSTRDYEDATLWELLVEGQRWSKHHGRIEYVVRIEQNESGSNVYQFNYNSYAPVINVNEGDCYVFNQDDLSNVYFPNAFGGTLNTHPINFSSNSPNGLLISGGIAYLDNVKFYLDNAEVTADDYNDETLFSSATYRRVEILIDKNTPDTVYYYCRNHLGMGSQLVVDHTSHDGTWSLGKTYSVGDVIYFAGSAYKCIYEHVADDQNFPGDNGSGFEYWDLLVQSGDTAALSKTGDLLTYNLSRTVQGDGSTIDVTTVPIGERAQLLSVIDNDTVFWRNYLADTDVIYVRAEGGADIDGNGTHPHRPFKTIRHACEYVEDNYSPLTPVKIKVSTGRYEEVGPISVPAGAVVMGDELRSTVVIASAAQAEYADDYNYAKLYLDHLTSIVFDILNNNTFIVQPGNNEQQITSLPPAGSGIATIVNSLKDEFKKYVTFRVESTGTDATISGTNTLTSNLNRIKGSSILHANRNFIASELTAYIQNEYPSYVFNVDRMKADIKAFIRAVVYDLKYEGTYKTVLAARRYTNCILGSRSEDMFWMRDVTGLRNMTLEGLTGVLNPPGVFDLYQRPTGGSYASFDPGWGPDDNRVWINTRSPYLQGNTCIGTGCIGAKIDGALHNGGLKSFVTNDFTQVLSDGIGFWAANNARAELVSMFTYYCTVGYLATDGGVIRATNGNNSYGTYGSVADGIDNTEVPREATVNNQNNQALVSKVFAGEFTDQIFGIQYLHCGENYTQATAEIIGAGANAEVEFTDFRNGGIYELRLVPLDGSTNEGGLGYTSVRNNAQEGDATSIKLAVTEDITVPEIVGQRIILISGDGTGQYGIVASYSNTTKIAGVVRESDGEPGWDHVLPGTPIATLTTNTQYAIEPLVTISAPAFTSTSYDLLGTNTLADAAYGDTYLTFEDVQGQLGTGDVETQDGLAPTVATFTVVKNGTNYDITITDPGAGYAVDDEITITGDLLGGTSPANDLLIRVKQVSDDSVNGIVDFYQEGVGKVGRFVVATTSSIVHYSDDEGETWSTSTLPVSGGWRAVIPGANRFIALRAASSVAGYSEDGITWTVKNLPSTEDWVDAVYAKGKFVAVAENSNTVAYSSTGETWSSTTIPDAPSGDSTASQWVGIAYGIGKFVAISGSDRAVATSTDGITWTRTENALPAGIFDWVDITYGANRFVALSVTGDVYYSLNGTEWSAGNSMPTQDGSTVMKWNRLKYSQGLFFAVCDTGNAVIGADVTSGPTSFGATSSNGIDWTPHTLSSESTWSTVAVGSPNGTATWLVLGSGAGSGAVAQVKAGTRAIARATVLPSGAIDTIDILDPGSGYDANNPPTVVIDDNSAVSFAGVEVRIGNKVLAQPDFINRGVGYRSTTTRVTITGNGYADIYPVGQYLTLNGIDIVPGPGAQLLFSGKYDLTTPDPTDLKIYTAVTIEDLGDDGTGLGLHKVRFRIDPKLEIQDNLEHETLTYIRERYSQCRITGHDFLDIGTGNFEETNYPELYSGGNYFVAAPENEVLEQNGGRVFYTSTDQDGNFRTGELFSVQQATGIVTISAQFFNLDGLSELALGGVRLGGSGAVIREFSTDPYFVEDSNNVVPTQRAIATFLANRLSVGGSDLETNQLIAGRISIGGPDNIITTTTGVNIEVPSPVVFEGAEISGSWVAQMMLHRDPFFEDSMQ